MQAAAAAAEASAKASAALETGDAELAAEAALECQAAAMSSNDFIQKEIAKTQDLKHKLTKLGVRVEVLKGAQPIDVMSHLGKRSGYSSVVWRAGCWGNRGVEAILAGAYQRVSAHLAVDAIGGKFWQLMLAERALQVSQAFWQLSTSSIHLIIKAQHIYTFTTSIEVCVRTRA